MSSFPLNFRQDELTVQVPTTLPPQAVTLSQEAWPPPELPPVPPICVPLEIPLMPDGVSECMLHAPMVANDIAITRRADWTFIVRLLRREERLSLEREMVKQDRCAASWEALPNLLNILPKSAEAVSSERRISLAQPALATTCRTRQRRCSPE